MSDSRQYVAVRQMPLRAGSMAIGEFGGAPVATGDTGPMYAAPAYWLYEMSQAALNPSRAFADAARLFFRSPANPLSYTAFGKTMAAGLELFERSTRRYGKPDWNITSTVVGGEHVPVRLSVLWERPFCRLLHFERAFDRPPRRPQPRLVIVAPMSGHYPTLMRDVYPGFLQLHGFVSMNLDRHIEAHRKLFLHLVQGDGDSAQKHREFYDEYLAVMDLAAEFYLQTVDTVFVRHALPKGVMTHRGIRIDPTKIRRVALFTVEGENDDISGVGQTEAAHRLCVNIPPERKAHWLQPAVGHYGVFNGSRFRSEIVPRVADFVLSNNAAGARGASRRTPSKITVAALRTMSPPAMANAANE